MSGYQNDVLVGLDVGALEGLDVGGDDDSASESSAMATSVQYAGLEG
jgi:hypothetical protein